MDDGSNGVPGTDAPVPWECRPNDHDDHYAFVRDAAGNVAALVPRRVYRLAEVVAHSVNQAAERAKSGPSPHETPLIARVEYTTAGPHLWLGGVELRSWLGVLHVPEADELANRLNDQLADGLIQLLSDMLEAAVTRRNRHG